MKMTRIAISAYFAAMGMVFASWASRIPDVQQQFALSNGQLGSLLFAIPFGHAFSIVPVGILVARYGSRIMTIVSMTLYAVALMLVALMGSYFTLFLMLMVLGAMANAMDVAVNTQAVALQERYGRSIMSALHGTWSLGGLLGGIIGATFASAGLGLIPHFATVLLLCLIVIAWSAQYLLPESEVKRTDEAVEPFNIRHIDAILWILGLIAFAGEFCEGVTYDWSAVYFKEVVHADVEMLRAGYIGGVAAMTLARFISDRFITRYGALRVLIADSVLIALGFALVVCTPYLVSATLGYCLVGLGMASVVPICYGMSGRCSSVKTSTALTFVSSLGFLGFLISPPIIGWISQAIGLHTTMIFGAFTGIIIYLLAKSKVISKLSPAGDTTHRESH